MTRPPTSPAVATVRCPRCRAPLGRLSAGVPRDDDARYCACCGLVMPAPRTIASEAA